MISPKLVYIADYYASIAYKDNGSKAIRASCPNWLEAPLLGDAPPGGGGTGYNFVKAPPGSAYGTVFVAMYDFGEAEPTYGALTVCNVGFQVIYGSFDGVTWSALKAVSSAMSPYHFPIGNQNRRYYQFYTQLTTWDSSRRCEGFWMKDPGGSLIVLSSAPLAPTLSVFSSSRIDVTTPLLPSGATSLSIERSADGFNWAEIATLLGGNVVYNDTGRTPATQYFYRAKAVGAGGSTPGVASSATTLAAAPDAPGAPTLTVISSTQMDILVPPLPARATSISLDRSLDGSTWEEIATGLVP
jgi:hypothetical protein